MAAVWPRYVAPMSQLQLALLLAVLCVAALALFGCRPYVEEFKSPLRRLVAALLFVGVLTVAVFLPVASYGDIGELAASDLSVPLMLVGHVILVAFLVVWWWLRGDATFAEFLHLSTDEIGPRIVQGIATGFSGWVMTILVMISAVTLVGSRGGAADSNEVPVVMLWIARLPVLHKLAIVAVAMTVEEAFFRGFLQPRVGWVGSSAMFALGHFSYGMPFMIVGVLTISLVIGRTFARRDDLLPCIVAHGVFDGVQIFVVLPYAADLLQQSIPIAG